MDPLTIAGLGLAGANLIGGAISGGKQNDLNEQALALERARELDRSKLRQMFMQRVTGGQTPEQMGYASQQRSAEIFGAGDPTAPGRANPFSRPLAGPSGPAPEGWRPPLDPEGLTGSLPTITDPTSTPQDRAEALKQLGDTLWATRKGESDRTREALNQTTPGWRDAAQTALNARRLKSETLLPWQAQAQLDAKNPTWRERANTASRTTNVRPATTVKPQVGVQPVAVADWLKKLKARG